MTMVSSSDRKPTDRAVGARVSADSIARLLELDQGIAAVSNALRQQLERLCEQLAETTKGMDDRNLNRLLFVLDHTGYLTRHSLTLVNARRELLRSQYP